MTAAFDQKWIVVAQPAEIGRERNGSSEVIRPELPPFVCFIDSDRVFRSQHGAVIYGCLQKLGRITKGGDKSMGLVDGQIHSTSRRIRLAFGSLKQTRSTRFSMRVYAGQRRPQNRWT